jgi:hypothetical protein
LRLPQRHPGFHLRRAERRVPTKSESVGPPDRWLKRLAEISQLGVLMLGIFGYFYTFLPVYNKTKLEQQIDEKTAALEAVRVELVQAEKSVKETRERLATAERNAQTFKTRAETQYKDMRLRLVSDLASFGRGTCPIFPKGSSAIEQCLRELASSTLFDSWNQHDRTLVLRELKAAAPLAAEVEREALSAIQAKQAANESDKAEYERNCAAAAAPSARGNCIAWSVRLAIAADDLRSLQSRQQWEASRTFYESLRKRIVEKL